MENSQQSQLPSSLNSAVDSSTDVNLSPNLQNDQPTSLLDQSPDQSLEAGLLKTLTKVIARIRQSLDLATTFQTTVTELRQLLHADRVVVLRLYPDRDWCGEFVYEDVSVAWNSLLHKQILDPVVSKKLTGSNRQLEVEVLAISDIHNDTVLSSEREIFDYFQVQSLMSAPLLVGNQLWGLLYIHQCSSTRNWQPIEIEFTQQIAEHLGFALQHTELLTQAHFQTEQQRALAGVIARIRESLDLGTIFQTTVTEVRNLLKADRVGIFKFFPQLNWEGEFVSEDVIAGCKSVISERVYDHCFGDRFAPMYAQGHIGHTSDIYTANCSECHRQILEKFQVRANVVAPLLQGKKLWGLLCIHQCNYPRHWEVSEIEFIRQISEQLSVAIQQAEYLQQVQQQSALLAQTTEREKAIERQKILAATIDKIRYTFDLETIFQTATNEVRHTLNADRVVVYKFNPDWSGKFTVESVGEGWVSLLEQQLHNREINQDISECSLRLIDQQPVVDTYLQITQGGDFNRGQVFRVCDDIYKAGFDDCYIQVLETYQARAYVIVAIYHQNSLWGLFGIYQNSGVRNWQDDEIYLLTQVSTQLSLALQQAEYTQQLKAQTAQISKAAERQRALATTVEKIRQSLDIEAIFHATTQEVRRLLNVERVAIYRFDTNWSGEFVADSIVDGWTPIVNTQPPMELMFLKTAKVGKYPRNETFVPILQGEKLWGLLVAYQNSQPRLWEDEEVNLLAQVGVQLGVALQQAETLKYVKKQAIQLAKVAQREKALATTVEKIRQSLDIETIFTTTTQEVRKLLEVERVAIYQFYPQSDGKFVAESCEEQSIPLVNNPLLLKDNSLQSAKEHIFSNNQNLVVADIYQQGLSPLQLAFLEQIQARSYVIVPIFQGVEIWGLLAAYQSQQPRSWPEHEISLLVQIATQLGVALQQAELLAQTRLQKEQLNQTLRELQQTQAQLIQGEKMAGLGQLVAGVAHEINNPINFIYANLTYVSEYTQQIFSLLDLYQKNLATPSSVIQAQESSIDLEFVREDLPRTLNSMHSGAERIMEMVESLRTFSRLDHAEMKPVDIHEDIDSTLLILQHRLKGSSESPEIEVIKQYGDLPEVECYAAQLNQVFLNLFTNAIDAIAMRWRDYPYQFKPKISVITQVVDKMAIAIRISDNGCGIPNEMRSRIFDPFFTMKEPGKGTGLGLSISYQIIVDKHGGSIECHSLPDQETEFTIVIPIQQSRFDSL